MRGRRPVRYRAAGGIGQLAVGAGPRAGDRGQPLVLVPAGLAAREPADPHELPGTGWERPGRLDDRRVGQDAPWRQVRGLGDLVPGEPQLPDDGEPAPRLYAVYT